MKILCSCSKFSLYNEKHPLKIIWDPNFVCYLFFKLLLILDQFFEISNETFSVLQNY